MPLESKHNYVMIGWIKNNFDIVEDAWINDDGSKEDGFLFVSNGMKIISKLSAFVSRFGGQKTSTTPTLEVLKESDISDTSGWHDHFNEWQRQGII